MLPMDLQFNPHNHYAPKQREKARKIWSGHKSDLGIIWTVTTMKCAKSLNSTKQNLKQKHWQRPRNPQRIRILSLVVIRSNIQAWRIGTRFHLHVFAINRRTFKLRKRSEQLPRDDWNQRTLPVVSWKVDATAYLPGNDASVPVMPGRNVHTHFFLKTQREP